MFKNPWFTLVLGLIVGLGVGYVLAERQAVPPARAAAPPVQAGAAMPEGHPPTTGDGAGIAKRQRLQQQAAELETLLSQTPDDHRLMVALGNLYYDAADWPSARRWYERAVAVDDSNPDVITDLAVVLRNLGEPEPALEVLDRAIARSPEHWQAFYNRVVILNFDLHRHDEAAAALAELKKLAESNPQVPDLSGLESEVMGGHSP